MKSVTVLFTYIVKSIELLILVACCARMVWVYTNIVSYVNQNNLEVSKLAATAAALLKN